MKLCFNCNSFYENVCVSDRSSDASAEPRKTLLFSYFVLKRDTKLPSNPNNNHTKQPHLPSLH